MKLIDIYKAVLSYAGYSSDEQGLISLELGKEPKPTFIGEDRLALPTRANLAKPKGLTFFHLFVENALKGPSEVFKKYRDTLNGRLNIAIGYLIQDLASLILSTELHSSLNPEQRSLLKEVNEIDEKFLSNYTSYLLKNVANAAQGPFISIYIKRGGTFEGKRRSRVGVCTSPLLTSIEDGTITGFREKDKVILKQILSFILPGIEDEGYFNQASDTGMAPTMQVLLNTSLAISSRINEVVDLFSEHLLSEDQVRFDLSWSEMFTDIDSLRAEIVAIPQQIAGEGNASIHEREAAQPPTQPVTQPASVQPVPVQQPQVQQPQYQPQPQPTLPVPMSQGQVHHPVVQQPMHQPVQQQVSGDTIPFSAVMQQQMHNPNQQYNTGMNYGGMQPMMNPHTTQMNAGMFNYNPFAPQQNQRPMTQADMVNNTPPRWLNDFQSVQPAMNINPGGMPW